MTWITYVFRNIFVDKMYENEMVGKNAKQSINSILSEDDNPFANEYFFRYTDNPA